MKIRTVLMAIFILIASSIASHAMVQTYRQFRDVSVNEDGKVKQSTRNGDLFEFKYKIDYKNSKITRVSIRRLDEAAAKPDNRVFIIKRKNKLFGSNEGRGGKVLTAVSEDGTEIIELGSKFAFTSRTGIFSQIITGVYKRVYTEEDHEHHYKGKDI
jgi:hypothetical protein